MSLSQPDVRRGAWLGCLLVLVVYSMPGAHGQDTIDDLSGLFPVVFNLATRARIEANGTCGETRSEVYCKLVEHVRIFEAENRQCDLCDARSDNPAQRHAVSNAIDGSKKWWQSPTLTNGAGYNYVTLTLDLGMVYQIAYIIVKAANSPRPGNWILERSIDGQTYLPWQYFAMTDAECRDVYGITATVGVPSYLRDDQVICTSRYSALNPLENGEIFVSLVNGRPGVFQPSQVLLDFTSARYVRLRFQKIRTLNADLMSFKSIEPGTVDASVTRRYYYSVKDISIGGQCICYGHATFCRRHDTLEDRLQCQCLHNTMGDNCERCRPKFNQKPWHVGGIQGIGCEECNCHGKSESCMYNATVDANNLSLNMEGEYNGGGVCQDCREYTTGINCERCIDGYYRPRGMSPNDRFPCSACNCQETRTSTDQCVLDDSFIDEGLNAGDCICKEGYAGPSCNACKFGYYGFPNCRPCLCNVEGSVNPDACDRVCECKENVEGSRCDSCLPGHFNLDRSNPKGCIKCFCFGVTTVCDSVVWGLTKVNDMDGWVLSTLQPGGLTLLPRPFDGWLEAKTYLLKVDNIDPRSYSQEDIHYWVAPMSYLGNRLSSYGGYLHFTIKYNLDQGLPRRYHLSEPNLVLEGSQMSITTDKEYLREVSENQVRIRLHEDSWYHLTDRRPVSRAEMMTVLYSLTRLLIRATYHTAQETVYLKNVQLDISSPLVMDGSSLSTVEQCQCPEGYAGLSCESCSPGWRRVNQQLFGGICRKCDCNSHASECDPVTGQCLDCKHSTTGDNCEQCLPGFYGDARHGTVDDCKPCACPLVTGNNFFAERCVARPTRQNRDAYECVNCQEGYSGVRCQMCSPGYYGNPITPGGLCRRCNCGGNIDISQIGSCNNVTGVCSLCDHNTEGEFCERCRSGYYGSAVNGDCRPCDCYPEGSNSLDCNPRNGQCSCRARFGGRQCSQCQPGYGNVERGCVRCRCSREGSLSTECDPVTGQCRCKPGAGGLTCNRCEDGFYEYSPSGCKRCNCFNAGTNNSLDCDPYSGRCSCRPGVQGVRCNECQPLHFGLESGKGCTPCNCFRTGSRDKECDGQTGQCKCKPGVAGRRCDRCQRNYYGLTRRGCQRCEPCDKPGHRCDQVTGKCVCPPNTEGPNCEICVTNGWGYNKDKGCKNGGRKLRIKKKMRNGRKRRNGRKKSNKKRGRKRNKKRKEKKRKRRNKKRCKVKENVEGQRCSQCRPGTFSLDQENPKGCTECFCFLRAQSCRQAPYVWTDIEIPSRVGTIVRERDRGKQLLRKFGHLVINSTFTYVPDEFADRPLYWMLTEFPPDMTLSYAGKLRFIHYFEGPTTTPGPNEAAPLAIIVGNGIQIVSASSNLESTNPLQIDIPLHEDIWYIPGSEETVNRRLMMVVLQKVEAIFIRAVQTGRASYAELDPITVQRAVPRGPNVTSTEPALGVELCDCPERYSGESCQNPGSGYFRVLPDDTTNLGTPETAIGHVKPCQCYGHSTVCHPETGKCLACEHNTTGDLCEHCADGFYGVATRGSKNDCQPCSCPLPIPSNNFSPSCVGGRNGMMCTACNVGYTGLRCESCAPGYYGNPQQEGDSCKPCRCNLEGSRSDDCEPVTGQCPCLPGIDGRTCEACTDPTFGVLNGQCVSCFTGCTGILLDDLAKLSVPIIHLDTSGAVYPWDRLNQTDQETKSLRTRLEALESVGLKDFDKLKDTTQYYSELADKLINRTRTTCDAKLSTTGAEACKTRESAAEILKNATDMQKVVKKTFQDIKDMVQGLDDLVERLLYNQTGVPSTFLTDALKNAKDILDQILARDFSAADRATRKENRKAERLSDSIKQLAGANFNVTKVRMEFDDVQARLEDLVNQTRMAGETATEALDKIKLLRDLLLKLKAVKDKIEKLNEDSEEYIREAKDLLSQAETNLLTSTGESNILDLAMDELAKKVSNLKSAMPHLQQLYEDAVRHALDLRQQAAEMERLFSKTRDLAENAVKAAKAYESIVKAIKEAKESAHKALKAAEESTAIAKVSDLEDEVNRLIRVSNRQLREADALLDEAKGLTNALNTVKNDLDNAMDEHEFAKDLLEELKRKYQLLPGDFSNRLAEIDRKNTEAEKTAEDALDLIKKINNTLGPKIDELQKFDTNAFNFDIGSEKARAEAVAQDIKDMLNKEKEVEDAAATAARKMSDIKYDLDRLKAKIRDARSRVNDMRMSLQADGQCYRSYRSPLTPSSTNEIRFGFLLNNTQSDMLIVLLQQSPQEFLAAEVRNNKVRLSWNSGKGIGSLSHDQILEPQKWFMVVAKRVGSVGQLKVWNLAEGTEQSTEMKMASMGAGCSLMNLNEQSTIFLAGSSDLYQIPTDITRQNLQGCLGDVFLDTKRLGVYNFKTNVPGHCSACKEVPQVQLGSSKVYVFNGRGFALFNVRGYSSKRTKVELEFKTFWENSRIFFVGNTNVGDFFSIELKDGHVAVHFNMGGNSAGSGITTNTYNNNQWTKVTFDRRNLKAILKVGSESISMTAPGPSFGLELQGAPMYYGGLPTELSTDKFRGLNKTDFFYGCMRNLNFGTLPPDDETSTFVDVQASSTCRENGVHTVGFKGDGYLILQSEHIEFGDQKNDISITFVTKEEDAVLFIVRDIPGENYYSISMVNGRLEARIRALGTVPVIIKSSKRFNDGDMHCVSLIKDGREIQLVVDDQVLGTGDALDVTFAGSGDLYLGGSPIDVDDIAATNKKLDGCVSNLIANGILLAVSDAKQYKRADVGRCPYTAKSNSIVVAPKPQIAPEDEPKKTTKPPIPTSCAIEGVLNMEDDAKSVANAASFLAEITKVRKKDLAKRFTFSFDFRTFYSNGLFGYLINGDKSFYFGIQLREGKLEMAYIYSGAPVVITFDEVLNDGKWHSVTVVKEDDNIKISYDNTPTRSDSIAQRLDIKLPLYLGGPSTPEDFTDFGVDLVTHSIRGCIRSLKVNGQSINITDTQVIQDVGGCYKNVESGIYFAGDAWGVYADDFVLDVVYSIKMDFRTTSQSGILVSASGLNRQGMTLELHEGQMKFAILNEDGEFRVETDSSNQYQLCDNQWHSVQAAYLGDSLTLSVDGGQVYTVSVPGLPKQVKTMSPLFIGGYAVGFNQATSLSSSMFSGCIRSLALNGSPIDWYQLTNSQNIRKTACPIS